MKKTRVDILIEVEFDINGHKEEYSVYIPFTIFVNAIRKFFDNNLVNIDGKDDDIWNTFVELGMIDKFEDNEDFINICKELYKGSEFEEEDLEDFKIDSED